MLAKEDISHKGKKCFRRSGESRRVKEAGGAGPQDWERRGPSAALSAFLFAGGQVPTATLVV